MKKLLFMITLASGALYAGENGAGAHVPAKLGEVEYSPSKDPHGNCDAHKIRKGFGDSRRERLARKKSSDTFVLPPAIQRVVKSKSRLFSPDNYDLKVDKKSA